MEVDVLVSLDGRHLPGASPILPVSDSTQGQDHRNPSVPLPGAELGPSSGQTEDAVPHSLSSPEPFHCLLFSPQKFTHTGKNVETNFLLLVIAVFLYHCIVSLFPYLNEPIKLGKLY